MSRKPNPPPDDAEQAARFIETAKALGAENSGEAFMTVVGKVAPKKKRPDSEPEKGEEL